MITASTDIINMINSPVRKITAKVELYQGSTLVDTFSYSDKLMNLTVERQSEVGKFFGFGICQHSKVTILDINREVDYVDTTYSFRIAYGVNDEYVYTNPTFYVTQCRRDEKTNALTIYGYDLLHPASIHYGVELEITAPYTVRDYASTIATFLGTSMAVERLGIGETCFDTYYQEGANIEGSETLRELLDDVAEVTQTMYFINSQDMLVFKRLSADSYDIELSKSRYIDLDTSDGRRLQKICNTNELEDSVTASTPNIGSIQYVRDNVFWTLRDDIGDLLNSAIAAVGDLSIRQFTCSWRGNFFTEPGDCIGLTLRDDSVVSSFLLMDTITYDGSYSQTTEWKYEDSAETESNPSNLGDVLKQTYARVDKVNKQIELVASEVGQYDEKISRVEMTTDGILASVAESNQAVQNLVQTQITPEDINIKIQESWDNGEAAKVRTSTGFTFNEFGLHISKNTSKFSTTIDEDGMTIDEGYRAVLTANHEGVTAEDLHAKTYLIIGSNSRFEDYNSDRTGCFWIGG